MTTPRDLGYECPISRADDASCPPDSPCCPAFVVARGTATYEVLRHSVDLTEDEWWYTVRLHDAWVARDLEQAVAKAIVHEGRVCVIQMRGMLGVRVIELRLDPDGQPVDPREARP